MKTMLAVFLGVFLSVTSVAIAADLAADPATGNWKLNAAKSKFNPGPAPKSGTRTYEVSADGMTTVTVKSVSGDGKETTISRTFKPDGKDYPVKDSQEADSISEKRINSHTADFSEKKAGKVAVTGRRVVSKDGKTLTVSETGTDATGAKFDYVLVYSKE